MHTLGSPETSPYAVLKEFERIFRDPSTASALRKSLFFTFNELCLRIRQASGARCNPKYFCHAGWGFLKAMTADDAPLKPEERKYYAQFVRSQRNGKASHIWS